MIKPKEPFTIGTRVRHTTDLKCCEGVVVWKYEETEKTLPHAKGKPWNVHWSNGQRGIYSAEDIQRIAPKNIKKIVETQLKDEGEISDEEE